MTRKEFLKAAVGSTVLGSVGEVGVSAGDPRQSESAAASATQPARAKSFPAGTTKAVVDFISNASFDRMPAKAVDEAKRCLIDGFGVVLAGATVHGSAIVREYVKAARVQNGATILGPEKIVATAAHAALANGASGHAMDYDDTQLSTTPDRIFGLLTHPTIPALAAALAVGERINVVGRAASSRRFSSASKSSARSPRRSTRITTSAGSTVTGTIGTFGAAAARRKLLKLTPTQLAHALAIAVEHERRHPRQLRIDEQAASCGPRGRERRLRRGARLARLHRRRRSASTAQWGFFQVLGGGADLDASSAVLGNPVHDRQPRRLGQAVSVRLARPSEMDAMLKLVIDHDIEARTDQGEFACGPARTSSNPLRYKTAKTELEAKFCRAVHDVGHRAAAKAGIREFTDEFVASAPVQRDDAAGRRPCFDQKSRRRASTRSAASSKWISRTAGRWSQPSDERYRGGPDGRSRARSSTRSSPTARARAVSRRINGRSRRSSRSIGSRASASWSRPWGDFVTSEEAPVGGLLAPAFRSRTA